MNASSFKAALLAGLADMANDNTPCECPACAAEKTADHVRLSDDEYETAINDVLSSSDKYEEAHVAQEAAISEFRTNMNRIVSHHMASGMNFKDSLSMAEMTYKMHKIKADAAKAEASKPEDVPSPA